jgi:hypothetical protein
MLALPSSKGKGPVMTKVLMKGPVGTCSANIMGHEYDVEGDPEEGVVVTVRNPEHITELERHGFTVLNEDAGADEEETPSEESEEEQAEKPKKKKKKRKNRK